MKKIYPYFNIVKSLFILAITMFVINNLRDFSIKDLLFIGFLIVCSIGVLGLYITYDDVSYTRHIFFFKWKIFYNDITLISWTLFPNAYTIWSNTKSLGVSLPFCRKKNEAFFDTIKKANPRVNIDVWWYKKSKSEITKTYRKIILFILLVMVVAALVYFTTGINLADIYFNRN